MYFNNMNNYKNNILNYLMSGGNDDNNFNIDDLEYDSDLEISDNEEELNNEEENISDTDIPDESDIDLVGGKSIIEKPNRKRYDDKFEEDEYNEEKLINDIAKKSLNGGCGGYGCSIVGGEVDNFKDTEYSDANIDIKNSYNSDDSNDNSDSNNISSSIDEYSDNDDTMNNNNYDLDSVLQSENNLMNTSRLNKNAPFFSTSDDISFNNDTYYIQNRRRNRL